MLDQLWQIWTLYEDQFWSRDRAFLEIRSWLEQHSVAADDFTFSMGCAMRDIVQRNR